ncbi:MAG: tetratricopeptide repeat protein [Pseudomonadales bacterium]
MFVSEPLEKPAIPAVVLTALLLLPTAQSHSQSMMILGGNSHAEACYRSAGLAAQFSHAGRDDLDECNKAIELGALALPDRVATYVNRGIVHAAREDYIAAVADYRRAEKMNPDSPEVAINMGNLWFLSGHYEEAVERYAFALENSAERHLPIAHYNRGMALEKAGETSAAIKDYEAALTMSPEWARVQKRLDRLKTLEQ